MHTKSQVSSPPCQIQLLCVMTSVTYDSPFFQARRQLWSFVQKLIVQLKEAVLCPFSTAHLLPCGFRGKKVR